MKKGASIHIFWDYKRLNAPKVIKKLHEIGFDSVEILCDQPLFAHWRTKKVENTIKTIKRELRAYDLSATIHAPFHSLNPASYNPGIVYETVEQSKECIRLACRLDSDIVVFHPGKVPSRFFKREDALSNLIKNCGKIIREAEKQGVYLCIENMVNSLNALCTSPYEINLVLDRIGSSMAKVTFDIAHANTTGMLPHIFARRIKKHVKHVHISDNTGSNNHLPLGLGNIEFDKVLNELTGYKGVLNVEGWMPHNQDEFLAWDKKKLDLLVPT